MGLGMRLVPLGVPRLNLVEERGRGRDTAPQALTAQMAEFDLGHVEPTAMLGRRMDLSFIRDSLRFRGITCFRKRGFRVGMQMVHHEANLRPMGSMLLNKCLDKVRPITCCPLRSDFGISLTSSWLKSNKNVCRSISLILCVIPQGFSRRSGERNTDFLNQLGGHFVHTYLGTLRTIRLFIDI